MMEKGFVFYDGPSQLDGKRIIGIATLKSGNRKTGNMVQTWILPADLEPHDAIKSGDDASVCGDCPLKPSESGVCYVLTFQGPLQIYRAWRRGSYPTLAGNNVVSATDGRMVRMGAYGDPAAIPEDVWKALLYPAKGWTGYTHQWRTFPWLRDYCQASCDNAQDVRDAKADGWHVFAIVPRDTNRRDYQRETGAMFMDCPAVTGRKSTTCSACGLCNGRRADIIIDAHGAGASKLVTEV
jgi:hypothetical protein